MCDKFHAAKTNGGFEMQIIDEMTFVMESYRMVLEHNFRNPIEMNECQNVVLALLN